MLWIVQNNLFREENYEQMIEALQRLGVPHHIVKVMPFVDELEPEPVIDTAQGVYVCGSTKLMRIATDRGWKPGSFMNDNMRYEAWDAALGDELLNHGGIVSTLQDIQFPEPGEFHIRPCEDGKAFSGRCFYKAEFEKWRQHLYDSQGVVIDGKYERFKIQAQPHTPVVVAPVKKILREYRFFVVDGQVITGSLYKMGGRAHTDANIDPDVVAYVKRMVAKWEPSRAFVIDIAMTAYHGLKVLEYNCINCSGFYACNTAAYVEAIESMDLTGN